MKEKLTKTQRIILDIAAQQPRGVIVMGKPDRRGTRYAGVTITGAPIIIAYCTPEFFLKGRGLLEPYGNERHSYRITDKGRAAVSA